MPLADSIILVQEKRALKMDKEEFQNKYVHLRMLKSIQQYLKADTEASAAVYPLRVPEDLLYQLVNLHGPEEADRIIHQILKMGLRAWSDKLYEEVFGSQRNLETFIDLMKKRTE
jgi:hypothetical protein